jgi:CheB methylesterase
MTGNGDDGARGLKEMCATGTRTIGQDEKSRVAYCMPKEAMKPGAVALAYLLNEIAGSILSAIQIAIFCLGFHHQRICLDGSRMCIRVFHCRLVVELWLPGNPRAACPSGVENT